jgi:hypothetical protein
MTLWALESLFDLMLVDFALLFYVTSLSVTISAASIPGATLILSLLLFAMKL